MKVTLTKKKGFLFIIRTAERSMRKIRGMAKDSWTRNVYLSAFLPRQEAISMSKKKYENEHEQFSMLNVISISVVLLKNMDYPTTLDWKKPPETHRVRQFWPYRSHTRVPINCGISRYSPRISHCLCTNFDHSSFGRKDSGQFHKKILYIVGWGN